MLKPKKVSRKVKSAPRRKLFKKAKFLARPHKRFVKKVKFTPKRKITLKFKPSKARKVKATHQRQVC